MILHGGCMNEFRDFLTMDADARPVRAGIEKLDVPAFRDFLARVYQRALPDADAERIRLLQDMNLATEEGFLNLACALLFTAHPEWIVPQFPVRAARFRGNTVHAFLERQNVEGPLPGIYRECHAFIMRHLHRIEAVRGITAPDAPEIPPVVFEELLVNALVHRDYSLSAPIRLFVFDNRIEIISPGHLPGNRTLENIRAGFSSLRNPILASFVAKGLLLYHGLGTGIRRALAAWPDIEFRDDREGRLFTAIVHRHPRTACPSPAGHRELAGQDEPDV